MIWCAAARSEQPDIFAAAQVSLGALGILTEATVRVVPAYRLQRGFGCSRCTTCSMPPPNWRASTGTSSSTTCLSPATPPVSRTTRTPAPMWSKAPPPTKICCAACASCVTGCSVFPQPRRWVAGNSIDPSQTEMARNRSFALLSTPSDQVQRNWEWHVPREQGIACVRQVIQTLEQRNDVYFPMEFRWVRGDSAWLESLSRTRCLRIAVHAVGEPFDYLTAELGPVFRAHGGAPLGQTAQPGSAGAGPPLPALARLFWEVRAPGPPRPHAQHALAYGLRPASNHLNCQGALHANPSRRTHQAVGRGLVGWLPLAARLARHGQPTPRISKTCRAPCSMQASPPTLVIDRARLRANVGQIVANIQQRMGLRIVAKSLPSLDLLQEVQVRIRQRTPDGV